jgi:hypothetical protein
MSPALLCCCHLSVSVTLSVNLRMIQKISMSPGGHRDKPKVYVSVELIMDASMT